MISGICITLIGITLQLEAYAAFDDGSEREIVEYFGAVTPHETGAIFAHTFVVEAIYLSNLTGFVITTDKCHPVRIADLQKKSPNFVLIKISHTIIRMRTLECIMHVQNKGI